MKPTIVILLSDKRSGSTMFQRELIKHTAVQTVTYSSHSYLETHHWLKGAVLLDLPAESFAGGKVYSGYGNAINAKTYLIDTIKGNVPEFVEPTNERALVFQGWEALCEKFAKPVFFEKSPQLLAQRGALDLMLEWMEQTDFQVKLIGLVRNPLSVQYSAWQLFYTDPEKRQYGWMAIQNNLKYIQQQLSAEQFRLVRYEDIIQESEKTFTSICEFIGLDYQKGIGKKVHAGSLTKWKTDPYFRLQLAPEILEMAQGFGYSEEELTNPSKPLPPLAWRLKRKVKAWYILSKARLFDRILKPIKLRWQKRLNE